MEIFKKIPEIAAEISAIGKNRKNSQQGYSYRGVDDVMNELSPLFSKHGVFPVMSANAPTTMTEITSRNGGQGWHSIQRYTIRLYATDGSFVEGIVDGEAIDYSDKSLGKCSSYAYRDFLLKIFCIPTEGDHDTDAHSHEVENPNIVKLKSQLKNAPKKKIEEIEKRWVELESKFPESIYLHGISLIREAKNGT